MFFKFLGKFVNLILDCIGGALNLILSILPSSPIKMIDNFLPTNIVNGINFFFPMTQIIVMAELWLVSITIFYAYSAYSRTINMIE